MSIKLSEILNVNNPKEYKVHLANWICARLKKGKGWNSWRGEKDDFNRRYIFSLMDFYHEPNVWLFGGVYEVVERLNNVTRANRSI